MEIKNEKEKYLSPEVTVVEVKQEGVICASGGEFPQWDPEDI